MSRQSITFTTPNDNWLKSQIESEEYTSKSELVNDLIRQAREQQIEVDYIRAKIQKGLESGISNRTASEILADSKSRLKKMK
ncbi:CopG family transcriptional regulator [Aureibaculum sp. A20]|uniref:CopG family transcriptional regulator n=1 Tax=Aureibaculum flavum TaxID=2795986 RepID=A0ABS0WUP3_9FLAO|nr:CopG family transcriptional regulator [Aureibaculum flavum]MBJ2175714.1 CopG family transcriptional regulator [Aureibaculum flavum]